MLSSLKPFTFLRIFLLFLLIPSVGVFADVPPDLLEEGKRLYRIQEDYFKKCLVSDWEGIYNYHHPIFKEKISIKEFVFFNGKVDFNYRQSSRAKISGGYALPTLKYIEENQRNKDMLGYPAPPRKFQITTNPLVKIKSFSIQSVAMTHDKQYAKMNTKISGKMTLPTIVRAIMKVPFNYPIVNYWEKVDGHWVITLLKDPRNLSGRRKS